MTVTFQPTESKQFFIGREAEIERVKQALDRQILEWIIHIPGQGGIGKTRFLEQVLNLVKERPNTIVTQGLVDFYKTSNQTGAGLLRELAEQLGVQHFPRFIHEANSFDKLSRMEVEADPGQVQEVFNKLLDKFMEDYRGLLQNCSRIVILCDTDENMYGVQQFFLEGLLLKIAESEKDIYCQREGISPSEAVPPDAFQTLVLIAGRQELTFPKQYDKQILRLELKPLTEEGIEQYFTTGGITLTQQQVALLCQRTGGRPLYVALSYDWLKNDVGTVEELLAMGGHFGRRLVEWIYRLPIKHKQIILDLAIAWRRMEPTLLAKLLQISTEEVEETIAELSKFSFIKYRPPSDDFPGSFLLHDEMRRLVNDYAWPQEGNLTREALLRQVVEWYESQLPPDWQENPTVSMEMKYNALAAEFLFYQAQLNLDQAFKTYGILFRKASYLIAVDFADQLNQEIKHFEDKLKEPQLDELTFRQALVLFRKEAFEQARNLWESLLRAPDFDKKARATTLMLLVELEAYNGSSDQALTYAEESEAIYKELIAEGDNAIKEQARAELAQLYNNMGYACRVQNRLGDAKKYYEMVLGMPGKEKNKARTLNNLGYIHFLAGDMVTASTYVGRSLQIRKTLKFAYELGLGYNTFGMIMESEGRIDEAVDLYYKAISQFEAARSDRGKALVLINLGRMRRQTNDFTAALEHLNDAVKILREKNTQDYLTGALNELGCVYRSRGGEGDWEEAEKLLKQSLAISIDLGWTGKIADNYEDLGILYYRRMVEAGTRQDNECREFYLGKALETIDKVDEVANGLTYILAKNAHTRGNLLYLEKKYEAAFDSYFHACQLMASASYEGKYPRTLALRRYNAIVDRLQEQLQALPELSQTIHFTRVLLEKRRDLPEDEQGHLTRVWEFLEATQNLAVLMANSSQ